MFILSRMAHPEERVNSCLDYHFRITGIMGVSGVFEKYQNHTKLNHLVHLFFMILKFVESGFPLDLL
jgi:hypothetical protein